MLLLIKLLARLAMFGWQFSKTRRYIYVLFFYVLIINL